MQRYMFSETNQRSRFPWKGWSFCDGMSELSRLFFSAIAVCLTTCLTPLDAKEDRKARIQIVLTLAGSKWIETGDSVGGPWRTTYCSLRRSVMQLHAAV